jgi:hypothetical protein
MCRGHGISGVKAQLFELPIEGFGVSPFTLKLRRVGRKP